MVMAKKKSIRYTDIIGQQGINLIERITLGMGFLWHPTGIEAGIDGLIEIRDSATGEVSNSIIQVQSKATSKQFTSEDAESFSFLCEERDLDYWINGNAPVILICSRPSTSEAYWVSVKDYFADLSRRRTRKVVFSKKADCFDSSCRSALVALAIPRDSGIYLSPLPKRETLVSNLLATSIPKHLFRATTDLRYDWQVWQRLRSLVDFPQPEWVLHEDSIISFHDLSQAPWKSLCKKWSSKRGDVEAWAASASRATRNVLVTLLNKCLGNKAAELGLRWSKNREVYFVEPTPTLSDRKFEGRGVFTAYHYKSDPSRVAYYRHSAVETRFRYLDGDWFLEIVPTYYFTRNGVLLDGYFEERLAGIKKLEKNSAVIGQLEMWASYFGQGQEAGLFCDPYPFLKFGKLAEFPVDFGIIDDLWLSDDDEDTSSEERWLFGDEGTIASRA
jgi:hypothetical protein